MAIVKMSAVTFAGKIKDFEKIADKFIYGRDIHLENAINVVSDRKGLKEFRENNEYDALVKNIASVFELSGMENDILDIADESMTTEDIKSYISGIDERINTEKQRYEELQKQISENQRAAEKIKPILDTDIELERLNAMEFIEYKFGHLPKDSYKTLKTYLTDTESFFVMTSEDDKDVWGFYFAPRLRARRIGDMFSSLYFEEVEIPTEYTGTPKSVFDTLNAKNAELLSAVGENKRETSEIISSSKEELCKVYNLAKKRQKIAEIKKKAIHSRLFFFVTGFMPKNDAERLEKEIDKSNIAVIFNSEPPEDVKAIAPPTKLKNNFVFRPFEMFVKMYGLPSYKEIDPTPILAITYILFFGIMFGDVGQSAIFAIAGFLIYKLKKWDLGGIIGFVGISGVIFGFLYGSLFGDEEILPRLFHTAHLRPMEQIGIMLGGTIAIGAVVIVFGMILNMINSIKQGKIGECIFNHNGLVGIVFYLSVIALIGNMLLGLGIPNGLLVGLILLTVLLMYLEEPISKLVDKDKHWKPASPMFFVESFFELFEVILSFFSNTISFLRIGAFAIVHVGMMQVVAVLSASGGVGGIIVRIVGNILVMGLEGLIVGIQVLRLEYYEMFSRYFSGSGKEYVSLNDK